MEAAQWHIVARNRGSKEAGQWHVLATGSRKVFLAGVGGVATLFARRFKRARGTQNIFDAIA